MGAVTDEEVSPDLDAGLLQHVELFKKGLGVEDDARSDDAQPAPVKNSRGNQVQDELLAVDGHGVTGIVSPLVPGDDVEFLGQQVDDLSLALISPLGPDNDDVGHCLCPFE